MYNIFVPTHKQSKLYNIINSRFSSERLTLKTKHTEELPMIKSPSAYVESVETLNKWAEAYYTKDDAIATDEEYDTLYHEVLEWEQSHQDSVLADSPTQRVGDRLLSGFNKLSHSQKMYSLRDVFNADEAAAWARNVLKAAPDATFYCELKYDGASLNLQYKKNSDGLLVLSHAISRGDGAIGEDVTENAKHIEGIPLTIENDNTPQFVEIRGEVVIENSDFFLISERRVRQGGEPFANARNAAAGGLRNYNTKETRERKLKFLPYGVGEISSGASDISLVGFLTLQSSLADMITLFGGERGSFRSEPHRKTCKNVDEVVSYFNHIRTIRGELPYGIDGIVIKVNEVEIQEQLGFNYKYPKWAAAWKFPAVEKVTTVKDIILQVGRSGAITPVAILQPIEIDGSVVERSTLHNFSEIENKDIRVGDQVVLIKSGDVIPKITKVMKDRRTGSEQVVKVPTQCPCCETPLIRNLKKDGSEGVGLVCPNLDCPERAVSMLTTLSSRKYFAIDSLGDTAAYELVYKLGVRHLKDLFALSVNDLLTLSGFKQRKAEKLFDAIQGLRGNVTLDKIIILFGIEDLGRSISKAIWNMYGAECTNPEVVGKDIPLEIPSTNQTILDEYLDFIANNQPFINELISTFEPVMNAEVKAPPVDGKWSGMSIAITGTLDKPRDFYEAVIEANGGEFVKTVNKKTTVLVVGDKPGSAKTEKAASLGIPVTTLNEFF